MMVSLDNTYCSQLFFLPARNSDGQLVGLKIVSQFSGIDNDIRIPTGLVLPRLTPQQEITLFEEKLALLNNCQLFFLQHNLKAWITIPPGLVDVLLADAGRQRSAFSVSRISRQ
ncbi:hypothetical protein WP7S18C02_25720 [Klebsiella sp. WP7-S18-CRE-02]|nr:hypothetical protein WP7S18C02_25720 [Klebsiella sp. WP7-S18-CRE-02]BBS96979.1 hypothetical protein WP7S18C03_25720 [Klebsiella sp. WP7-S18-CRE-03]BBT02013.1 hypothetical protein WP7S18E04_25750 [Klebsiella sp. WP7-S18-ESBL-04]